MAQKEDTGRAGGKTLGTGSPGGPQKNPGAGFSLTSVVSALAAVQDEITHTRSTRSRRSNLPSRQALIDIVEATAKTIESLNKLNLPAGVDIKIKATSGH